MRSLNLFNSLGLFLQGNLTVVLIKKWKLLICLGPDQLVYLVWKASEEALLVKPLVHVHQVVSVVLLISR